MGWFEDQIKERRAAEQRVLEDSLEKVTGIVLGRQTAARLNDKRIVAASGIEEILKYYHRKPVEFPGSIKTGEEQLEYALRHYGMMRRNVTLAERWYKDAFGALIAFTKDDLTPVALLPNTFSGYSFVDPQTGERTKFNAKSAKLFDTEAICFYQPLPQKKLSIPDLLLYMKDCVSLSDLVVVLVATMTVAVVGMLLPEISRALTGPVLASGRIDALVAIGIFIGCTLLTSHLINSAKDMVQTRLSSKISLGVEAEKRVFAKWLNVYADSAEPTYNPPSFIKANTAINTTITLFSNIVLYSLAIENHVDQSSYFAFTTAYGMVMGAFMELSQIALAAAQIQPTLEMAEPFLSTEPETSQNKQILTSINGSVALNHVSFRYGEDIPYILDDLSLNIKPGEYVAVVGRTGCGKSTLVRLLLGFEKPEKGAIYYSNKDLNDVDLPSLRKQVGTVMQDAGLFQGSIYENIVITAPQLTVNDAWEAAEAAGIAEDIRNMPMGMHTMISEGQGGVSGGQRQRIMIACAIAPKPKLLIFDEATSALDNKTQKQVSDSLDAMGCTRLVIAHRLSTIRHCDRILVLDDGKIIEDGTYDELIGQGGYFAELVERQQLGNVS